MAKLLAVLAVAAGWEMAVTPLLSRSVLLRTRRQARCMIESITWQRESTPTAVLSHEQPTSQPAHLLVEKLEQVEQVEQVEHVPGQPGHLLVGQVEQVEQVEQIPGQPG